MNDAKGDDHDSRVAVAFDGQAARFEKASVQTDPDAIRRLVAVANFPPDSLIFDAGCGPGLISIGLLETGHRVVGWDLSAEMIERARVRCASFGTRARFEQRSVAADPTVGGFDGSISRYVLHHVVDPVAFIANQMRLLRPGGILVLSDHSTDPRLDRAEAHRQIETLRDRTHTHNLSFGGLIDLFVGAGLEAISAVEEAFTLDFDEWFDRGTSIAAKSAVRTLIMSLPPVRGFQVVEEADGRLTIHCWRAIVRGSLPGSAS